MNRCYLPKQVLHQVSSYPNSTKTAHTTKDTNTNTKHKNKKTKSHFQFVHLNEKKLYTSIPSEYKLHHPVDQNQNQELKMAVNTITLPIVKTKTDQNLIKELDELRAFLAASMGDSADTLNAHAQEYLDKRFNKGKKSKGKIAANGEEKKKKEPSEYNIFIGEQIRALRQETPGMTFKDAMTGAVANWKIQQEERKKVAAEVAEKAAIEAPVEDNDKAATEVPVEKTEKKAEKTTKKSTKKAPVEVPAEEAS